MKTLNFVITILFLALLSLSLASRIIPVLQPIAIEPVALCVYYVATLFVVSNLNARFPL